MGRKIHGIVTDQYKKGMNFIHSKFRVREWKRNSMEGIVTAEEGPDFVVKIFVKEEELRGAELEDYTIVGNPTFKLVELAKTRVR